MTRLRTTTLIFAAACLLAITGATPASAGTYTISGTCGLWDAWDTGGTGTAVYPECPVLVARNLYGNFSTAPGGGAGWIFRAPPGTVIVDYRLSGLMYGYNGWQAALFTEPDNRFYENCPGPSCPGATKFLYNAGYPAAGTATIVARLRCGAAGGCPNNDQSGNFRINASSITLSDTSLPSAALAGGSLLNGAWQAGTRTLAINGSDNSGISEYRAYIDGALVARTSQGCIHVGQKVPCPNGQGTLQVPTAGLADGTHQLTAEVVDAAGNAASARTEIYTDNTPPTQPLQLAVEGGAGWRATDTVKVSWANPPQSLARIAGATYRLCPSVPDTATAAEKAKSQERCVSGSRSGLNLQTIGDLELPGPGLWDLQLWLVDAASNQQPASAVTIGGLGFDDTPPSALAFAAPDPADPTRVRVHAADSESGIAAGAVEVRRDGEQAWQPLPTQAAPDGLTAVLDDETLAKGLYFLRARATNPAGLEASTDRDTSGLTAMAKLPLRLASTITAGRKGKRTCRGRGKARSCRYRLSTKPRVRIGRTTRLYGRVTVAGKAMAGAAVEVWRRLELDGASWVRVGTVSTSRTGRFSYRAQRGPARTIRFRFPGAATIRGRNSDVALRVAASSTMRPSRRNVINGEYVTFRGRLAGGWQPPAGALVELQVYSRGQWRTFAQPRANANTGRWSHRYRFETVRGRASFRFRARIRRQPGFPFITGASRPVRVVVRGL